MPVNGLRYKHNSILRGVLLWPNPEQNPILPEKTHPAHRQSQTSSSAHTLLLLLTSRSFYAHVLALIWLLARNTREHMAASIWQFGKAQSRSFQHPLFIRRPSRMLEGHHTCLKS